MKKIRSFSFWTALAGAVTILVNALGKCFGFSVDNQIITDVIMAVAGVLVVLGIVTMPKKETTDSSSTEQQLEEQNTTEEDKLENDENK